MTFAGASAAPVSPAVGLPLGEGPEDRWWEGFGPGGAEATPGHPWWDDAPVPPPVVVASADGRTPAVTFAPDADPFSAGGRFAPPPMREGEPAVVVHAAPDAALSRGARRARNSARAAADAVGTHREVLSLLRERDDGPDTGSLVRPYVALADHATPPALPAEDLPAPDRPTAYGAAYDAGQSAEWLHLLDADLPDDASRPRRRPRRAGPLDRIIEVVPTSPGVPAAPRPVTEWPAPWSPEATETAPAGDASPRSLFEPVAPTGTPRDTWAAPAASPLPSRKELRARERASGAASPGTDEAGTPARDGRLTGRKLAKSGVLAVTAVGVVAASAPNAFSALGLHLPTQHPGSVAPAALVNLAGTGALPAPHVAALGGDLLAATGSLSSPQGDSTRLADNSAGAHKDLAAAAKASAEAAARAGAVGSGAGRTLVDVARQQVVAESQRKARIAQQVSRNTVRDPRSYARLLLQQRGWGGDQFACLNLLWNRESGWNYQAMNPSSGAYGIPQALPGSKMGSVAPDWRTNPATQIKWGLNYIGDVYVTPCGAWGHSQSFGWY